jgi:hypothetical protein
MMTFIRQPTQITYSRYRYEWLGVYISVAVLILLCGALAKRYVGGPGVRVEREARL